MFCQLKEEKERDAKDHAEWRAELEAGLLAQLSQIG